MFIFTLMNPVGPILGRRHRLSRDDLWQISRTAKSETEAMYCPARDEEYEASGEGTDS